MTSQLELYEELDVLHGQMAEAALAANWDRAIGLDHEADRVLAALRTLVVTEAKRISAEERSKIATLITRVLEKQTVIRTEIKSWQEDVAPFLTTIDGSGS